MDEKNGVKLQQELGDKVIFQKVNVISEGRWSGAACGTIGSLFEVI